MVSILERNLNCAYHYICYVQKGVDANAQFLEVWEPDVLNPAAQTVFTGMKVSRVTTRSMHRKDYGYSLLVATQVGGSSFNSISCKASGFGRLTAMRIQPVVLK
jgi:hypothetical protein